MIDSCYLNVSPDTCFPWDNKTRIRFVTDWLLKYILKTARRKTFVHVSIAKFKFNNTFGVNIISFDSVLQYIKHDIYALKTFF